MAGTLWEYREFIKVSLNLLERVLASRSLVNPGSMVLLNCVESLVV